MWESWLYGKEQLDDGGTAKSGSKGEQWGKKSRKGQGRGLDSGRLCGEI